MEAIDAYRSAVTDALGRRIPDDGEHDVWLGWDCVHPGGRNGRLHFVTAREVRLFGDLDRVRSVEMDPQTEGQEEKIALGEEPKVLDVMRREVPTEGPVRVFLDDLWVDRVAPPGWVHLRTARETAFLLSTGRVVALSLDHDLGDRDGWDYKFGKGSDVIDFLEEQHGIHGRELWPREGITLHTANSVGRQQMMDAMEAVRRRLGIEVEQSWVGEQGDKPHYDFPAAQW